MVIGGEVDGESFSHDGEKIEELGIVFLDMMSITVRIEKIFYGSFPT